MSARGSQLLAFENRYRAKDGTYRWLQSVADPLPGEQTIYAAARDITEGKEAKATIARYSRDLETARQAEAEQRRASPGWSASWRCGTC